MNAVETALYGRLTGRAALTALLATATSVYNQVAPPGTAYPLLVFGLQTGRDDNKSPHRARQLLYLVKAVSAGSMQDAGAIDAEIDTALHGVVLTVSGWTNFWLMRETDVRYEEQGNGGQRYYHAGGVYRVRIAQ